MAFTLASESGRADGRNDDWAGATSTGLAVVLDGLTPDGSTGCAHGTGWFVHQVGTALLALAADRDRSLTSVLDTAIRAVAGMHSPGCDLTHPGSPAATLAMLRAGVDSVEYLVLADAVAVFDAGDEPLVVTDRRVQEFLADEAHAAAGADQSSTLPALIRAQQRIRNVAGGYWVVQHDPAAAAHALTGTVQQVRGAVLLSDGAAVLATDFDAMSWRELLDVAYRRGPAAVIAATREVERRDPDRLVWPRYKTHDDATVVVYQP